MTIGTRRCAVDPGGTIWSVGRNWIGKRRLKTWAWRRERSADIAFWNPQATAFDGMDLEGGLILLVGAIVCALIIVPLILFGIELIILGCVIAIGVVARSVFGKPWTVTAIPVGTEAATAVWQVRGWRKSGQLINSICTALESGESAPTTLYGATFLGKADPNQPV